MKPLISVIITTYDRPDKLKRALPSVLNQTLKDIEIIVVDGKCLKETSKYMHSIDDDRVIYHGAGGTNVQEARNLGSRIANGKYLAYLDDDDEWHEDKLEKQIKLMDEDTGLVICYSRTNIDTRELVERPKSNITFKDLLKSFNLSHTSSYLLDKEKLKEIGGFKEFLVGMHEYDIGLELAHRGYKIKTYPEILMEKYNPDFSTDRRYFGSYYVKVHEIFLFYRFWGKYILKELSLPEILLVFFKTIGLFGVLLTGYIIGGRMWDILYELKTWYLEVIRKYEDSNANTIL